MSVYAICHAKMMIDPEMIRQWALATGAAFASLKTAVSMLPKDAKTPDLQSKVKHAESALEASEEMIKAYERSVRERADRTEDLIQKATLTMIEIKIADMALGIKHLQEHVHMIRRATDEDYRKIDDLLYGEERERKAEEELDKALSELAVDDDSKQPDKPTA